MVEIWLSHQPLRNVPCAEVQKGELLFFVCIDKGQVATDLSSVGNGCVSWGPRWWGPKTRGAVLSDLPHSRVWELLQNTEFSDSAGKWVKGHISLWHLPGRDHVFCVVIHHCSVNINLETYYAVFYMSVSQAWFLCKWPFHLVGPSVDQIRATSFC